MMQFEKMDIINLMVVIVLGAALIMTIFYGYEQLASIMASGLIGYLGGTVRTTKTEKVGNEK